MCTFSKCVRIPQIAAFYRSLYFATSELPDKAARPVNDLSSLVIRHFYDCHLPLQCINRHKYLKGRRHEIREWQKIKRIQEKVQTSVNET